MSKDQTVPRMALRVALANRDATKRARDKATETLQRADLVLEEIRVELAAATNARDNTENQQAYEIAGAIRRGGKASVTLPAVVKEAQQALCEVESRRRMAMAARKTIESELEDAERAFKQAEAATSNAALTVMLAEAEAAASDLDATLAKLCATDAAIMGLARFWPPGTAKPVALSPALRTVVARLLPLKELIDRVRPQRTILAVTEDAVEAGRWRKYHAALLSSPDAKFADVIAPEISRPAMPQFNEIEAARLRAAMDVAVA